MKKIFMFLTLSALPILAQIPDFKKPVQDAMQQVSVMPGIWQGKGWTVGMNGEKSYTNVKENIQWKLDSTLILLEGFGKKDDGTVVHNALGFLSYDPFKKNFTMTSHLSSGLSTIANWEVIKPNKNFKWWFDDGRGGTIRYTINTEGKHWKEEGERTKDGKIWNKFFEMNLDKVD